jgi:hypothetical protein
VKSNLKLVTENNHMAISFDLTFQTIKFGNCAVALGLGAISTSDILIHLNELGKIEEKMSIKDESAYAAACQHSIKDCYLPNGSHFLSLNKDYAAIYAALNGDLLAKSDTTSANSEQIFVKISSIIQKTLTDAKSNRHLQIVLGRYFNDGTSLIRGEVAAHLKMARHSGPENILKAIGVDRFCSGIKHVANQNPAPLLKSIIARLNYLKTHAPIYFEKVAVSVFRTGLRSINLPKFLDFATEDSRLELINLIPDLLPLLSPLANKIWSLTQDQTNYVLGGRKTQNLSKMSCLIHLSKVGPEQYAKEVEEDNKRDMIGVFFPSFLLENIKIQNEENTLQDSVWSYPRCDIIAYLDDDSNAFVFNRPEFETLVEKRVNPYTNVAFPNSFIEYVEESIASMSYLCPESGTMMEILSKIAENKPAFKSSPQKMNCRCTNCNSHPSSNSNSGGRHIQPPEGSAVFSLPLPINVPLGGHNQQDTVVASFGGSPSFQLQGGGSFASPLDFLNNVFSNLANDNESYSPPD